MDKKTKNGIIITSIVVIGVYAIYKFLNKSKKSDSALVIETSTTNPTLSKEKYKEIADAIFEALNGWGANNTIIYNNFALLKNNDDLMEVIAAFGVREVPNGLFNPLPNSKGNLPEMLGEELSQDGITNINSILVKNGINIRFNKNGQLTTI